MPAMQSQPQVISAGPYNVVGVYVTSEGEDEPWGEAMAEFERRRGEVTNRAGDSLLAFLYRPHRDDPSVPDHVRSCFIGVEAADLSELPEGMKGVHYAAGEYLHVVCSGDDEGQAAAEVGPAIGLMEEWIARNGYREGDACFCLSHEDAATPPHTQHIYLKLEQPD